MAEYNFNATSRIPTRPLSYENKDLAEAKEIVADYKNAAIYIVTESGEFVNVTASATQILEEVMNQINQDPTIIGNGSVTLPSGETVTIQECITNLSNTVEDHEERISNLENSASSGSGSTGATSYMNITVSSAGTWTALSDNSAYYQDIAAIGILATDRPTVDIVTSESFTAAEVQLTEFAKIYKITTSADVVRVYATSALASDITLQLKINR